MVDLWKSSGSLKMERRPHVAILPSRECHFAARQIMQASEIGHCQKQKNSRCDGITDVPSPSLLPADTRLAALGLQWFFSPLIYHYYFGMMVHQICTYKKQKKNSLVLFAAFFFFFFALQLHIGCVLSELLSPLDPFVTRMTFSTQMYAWQITPLLFPAPNLSCTAPHDCWLLLAITYLFVTAVI